MLDLDYLLVVENLDYPFYRAQLGADAKVRDPAAHYLTTGWADSLDPRPDFSTGFYLERNPDVREAGLNPLVHYLTTGQEEGRVAGIWPESEHYDRVAARFDAAHYRAQLPSGAEIGDPVAHFLALGWRWRIDPVPEFSVRFYLQRYPDVRRTGRNPYIHYLCWGKDEGRAATPDELEQGDGDGGEPRPG